MCTADAADGKTTDHDLLHNSRDEKSVCLLRFDARQRALRTPHQHQGKSVRSWPSVDAELRNAVHTRSSSTADEN